jgi:hypothetical protein
MTRHLEDDHQLALFRWARMHTMPCGEKVGEYLYAIPNGGNRNPREGARLKAQGVKAGVSDIHLPIASRGFHGLWIELKAPKTGSAPAGKVQPSQLEWIEKMTKKGHLAVVCWGWQAAADTIKNYLQ